jgi:hypothetical protein
VDQQVEFNLLIATSCLISVHRNVNIVVQKSPQYFCRLPSNDDGHTHRGHEFVFPPLPTCYFLLLEMLCQEANLRPIPSDVAVLVQVCHVGLMVFKELNSDIICICESNWKCKMMLNQKS